MEIIAQLRAQDVEFDGESADLGFDFSGGWLNDESALLLATELGPVVATNELASATPVKFLNSEADIGSGIVDSIQPLTSKLFAAVIWRAKVPRLTTVWRILAD